MKIFSNKGTFTLDLVIKDPEGKFIEEQHMMTDTKQSVINRLKNALKRLEKDK